MPSVASVYPTGNAYLDGVLSGIKWGVTSLTYSFPTDASFYGSPYGSGEPTTGFEAFTAQQQNAVRAILEGYAAVTNLSFTEVTESSSVHGDLRYAESDKPSTAWAYYPSSSPIGGDAWFNNSKGWYDNPVLGNYAWLTMIHETGHALGLKHPHSATGPFGAMPLDRDSLEYSVMSYRSYIGAGTGGYTNESFGYPQTLMMYDIAAMQTMYGADYTTNGGDTVYRWDPNTGRMFINGVGQAAPGANKIFMTLWDGGGNDTYDFSNYTTNLSVSLQPGAWTTTSAAQKAYLGDGHYATGNIANALLFQGNTASLIENAIGGAGNDTIVGNVANNKLTGGGGNDSLDGDAGTDTAIYSGLQVNYQLIHNANGTWTVTDLRAGSPDGTDTLINIELVQFSDKLVSLDSLLNPPSVDPPAIASFSDDSNIVGDGITNDNTLTLTGTAAAGLTIRIYDGATLLGSVTAGANGAWSFTTAVLADGVHVFTATATNGSGETSAASLPLNVTVDTVAPNAPAIVSFSPDSGTVGDGITNATAITLNGTAAAGSLVHVYDGGTLIGTTTAAANGSWSYNTSDPNNGAYMCGCAACMASQGGNGPDNAPGAGTPLADGVHSFTAKAMDAAGNLSLVSSALAVTVDTAAPGAPVIASFSSDSGVPGDGITNDNTLTLTGTAAANAAVKVYDGATLIGSVTANASGAWSFTTATLADGAHSFTATATDAAGNTSAASAALAVTIDTAAPDAPVIASFSGDSGVPGDGITNDNTLTLTGTAAANATVKVYDGATLIGSVTANASGAWSFTTATLADGGHSFTATATDAAGNTSAASAALAVTIDTAAPDAPVIASFSGDSGTPGDGITNDNTLTLTGTAAANATVKIYDGATLIGSVTANAAGAWSFTTNALADGAHSFTATATDAAGNTSAASAALNVTVDTVAPGAPVIASFSGDSGTPGDGITNDNTLTLTGTAAANAAVKVYDGATLIGSVTANASGAWSFTTATLADGAHSFTATATDAAGNTSAASAALAVTIDTAAPDAPVIASFSGDSGVPGDGITNDNTLTLTGTAAANATVKVYDGATLIGSVTANAAGAWSFTTNALADGAHSFTATATDAAGNTSAASAALSVTVDTVAPGAPVIASFSGDSGTAGDGITNDNTLTLTGTAAANATVKVYDGATLIGSVTANASGAWSFTTNALADGAHSFTATATDAAGNTSAASAALAVTIDTAAPDAPVIASFSGDSGTPGDGITNDNTLTLTGTAAANATVKVYDGATLIGSVTANAAGAWSFTTATLADGGHSFTATATDAAGNTSAASAALSVTVDTVAPGAPVIASFSGDSGTAGDGITNDNTLTLAGTAAAGTIVKVYDGATLIGSVTANASGAWSFTTATLADGGHSFTATATDAAGNTSAASAALAVTVDTVAPDTPVITSFADDTDEIGDGLTNDNTITLNGSGEPNSTVTIYDNGNPLGTATVNASGVWTFDTAVLADGDHVFTATAADAAGNVSGVSAALNVTIDTGAPDVPTITSFSGDSGTAGDGITNDNTLTLTGTAAANATVKVYDGATLIGSVTANAAGAWSFTTATLADGGHSFTATATDAAGNTSAASAALSVTVDTVAPGAPVIASFSGDSGTAGDGITNDNTLTLTGTAAANATVKVYDGATLIGSVTANASGAWLFTTATLADGGHSFTATATDAAGNTSAASAALAVTVDTVAPDTPVITSFADDTDEIGDGLTSDNTITLNGSGEPNSTVTIYDNGNPLGTATVNASGVWTFDTAVLADGDHVFTATAADAAGNVSGVSAALNVTIDTGAPDVPTITSFSGDSGTAGDGITNDNTLTLTGTAAAGTIVKVYDGATLIGSVTANASGAWSFTTATLADGVHSFTATATDAAGNTSAASGILNVTIDTEAPDTPVIENYANTSGAEAADGPANSITNDNTLLLTGSAPANTLVKIYDGAALIGTVYADASGSWSLTTPALADGNHTFTATATDAAGNSSAVSEAFEILVDTVAPDAPSIAGFSGESATAGDGITNENILTLTGTAAADTIVTIRDGQAILGTAVPDAAGAWSFTTATLADGGHSFTATATDAAGNTSAASAALAVTVDTVAPDTPVITSFADDTDEIGDGLTSDNTITLNGSGEPNSTVTIYDNGNPLGTATVNASGVWTFDTAVLADGDHVFTATAADAAGNVSGVSAALNVTIDTGAPDVPTITSFSGDSGTAGDGITNDNTLTLTGTAAAGTIVKVYDGATLIGSVTANASGAWSFTTATLADGVHSFTATATDAAGNTSAASAALAVTIDTAAPGAPVIASFSGDSGTPGDGITNDNTLTLNGTAAAGTIVKVYDGATLIGSVTANASGAWSFTTATLADGAHSFTATATDAAGNTSAASAALSVTVDTVAPGAPVIASFSGDSGTAGDGITNDNTLTLTGTAAANATVKVYDGATLIGSVTANASGAWSFTTATLADGGHSFTATATDAAGNTSAASAALAVTIDTAAPDAPVIASFSGDSGTPGDGITNDNTLTLTGTAAAGTIVKVYDGATLIGSVTANASGAWSFTTNALADGAHSFTATATDAAGNTSAASAALAVTVDTVAPGAPVIASFSGDSGVPGDGITNDNTLTLTGTAAANATVKVYDGATLIGSVTANAAGAWSFTTATLADGGHSFTATATDAAGNTSAASAALAVTVDTVAPDTPVITSFADDTDEIGDGLTSDNTITLNGSGEPNSTVTIYDNGNPLGTATVNASGVWTFDTAVLADGDHVFTATAADAAGNVSGVSAALNVTIDTGAPDVPTITSFSGDSGTAGDGITNDNTLTLTGTAAANATVKVYDGATLIGSVTANASGAWSFTTATLADGAHSFTATATDAAGNTSAASGILNVTIDTEAPDTPVIENYANTSGAEAADGPANSITNDNTLLLTGSAPANTLVKIYDGAALIGTVYADASGSWSLTTPALADGNHTFTATATDAAGNSSAVSEAFEILVDTVAPDAPSIAGFSGDSATAGDGITNENILTLTGTAAADTIVTIRDGQAILGTAVADADGAWSLTTAPLADGGHSFTATATDAAGNTSAASAALSVTVDTAAPDAPTITSFSNDSGIAGDGITNDNTLKLSGTAAAHSLVHVFDGSMLLGSVTADSDGTWSFDTAALSDGLHSFSATATDAAGNVSAPSATLPVTVDTLAPDRPVITNFLPFGLGGGAPEFKLSGIALAGTSVTLFDKGVILGTAVADASGAWSYSIGQLSNGYHAFTASDVAGNASDAAALTVALLNGGNATSLLIGTASTNLMFGNGGCDLLKGSNGDDYLDGGSGADVMIGGLGNDTYVVDDAGDVVVETSVTSFSEANTAAPAPLQADANAGGIDTVIAKISYKLPGTVENLILAPGFGNIDATGNNIDNVITGNEGDNIICGLAGDDVLNGGGGNDVLEGGLGADRFVFMANFGMDRITDYSVGEDSIAIDHTLFADLQALLASAVDDEHGNVIITASAHDVITIENVTKAMLQAHPGDFHFV